LNTRKVAKSEGKFVSVADPSKSVKDEGSRTPFVKIDNSNMRASIVGKDCTGHEEGMSTVLIEISKGNYKEFKFQPNDPDRLITALKVPSGLGTDVYVIVGGAYGTLSFGGSLYSLNVFTGETKLVYKPNEFEQVVDAKVRGDKIKLTCYKFDDNFMEYTTVYHTINA